MSQQKICMGCFAVWDSEVNECIHCGWSPHQEKDISEDWYTGKKLDKRYLLGGIYLERGQYIIWRAFDEMLEIQCFLMREIENGHMSVADFANVEEEEARNKGYQILSCKIVAGEQVLVFSMKNPWKIPESCYIFSLKKKKYNRIISNLRYQGANSQKILPKDTILEDCYRIVGPLGIGGFGITYLCEDIRCGRNVAVKEYFPAQWAERDEGFVSISSSKFMQPFLHGMERFRQEIKMTAKFIHDRKIITLYDAFECGDTVYMVMEYLHGESLGMHMKKMPQSHFATEEWKQILLTVTDALRSLHEHKMVHSDISPGNIMITDSGQIVLIDLGAAKYFYDTSMSFATTFLKPDYAAPEQYQTARSGKAGNEGPWTDIYALGATTYYCLVGAKPKDVIRRLDSSINNIDFPTRGKGKLSRNWKKIIQNCMELEREKRPQCIEELQAQIHQLL